MAFGGHLSTTGDRWGAGGDRWGAGGAMQRWAAAGVSGRGGCGAVDVAAGVSGRWVEGRMPP